MIPEAKNQRHRASRRLAVALAAWLLPGAVQAGVFAEFRYTTVVAAAVNGDRIGWIDDQDGVTSLWTRLGTGGAPQIVARSGRDDGAPLGDLSLAASGRWIAWRTGEASPAAGRTANPADLVAGPQSTIWVAAPGGAPCHVAAGDSPRLAHLANRIAFLRAGDLWMADLSPSCADTRRSARLALHLRNPLSGIVWSPRDDAIAFVVHRGSYGFNGAYSLIGVFHPGSDRSVWIAPAFERDTAPSWSPDGKQIAFLRVAGVSYEHAAARAWDAPARFQVMIGDVATGVAHTVWSSPGADADFRQWHEPTTPPLRWLDAHRSRQWGADRSHAGQMRSRLWRCHFGWHRALRLIELQGRDATQSLSHRYS
jgi:dipeptidyl aminopeptidase/acylaminoacyl peptidase